MVYALIGITCILALLCFLSIREAANPPAIHVGGESGLPDPSPLVSVIIPARDEEANIGPCLRTILDQDYRALEVIVVDDRSTDRTASIVEAIGRDDQRVRLIRGKEKTSGWLGKSHAIHQGVRQARGAWFLFVDADTRHHTGSLAACMTHMHHAKADMLSLYPHFDCGTFWEKVLQPAVGRMILIAGPMMFVNSRKRAFRVFAMAIGQFILIRRPVYEAIGGHVAVRSVVTEDVALAKNVKKAGYALDFLYGTDLLSTRMYRSFAEIWRGWSRSFYPAMGGNPILAVLQWLLLFLFGTLPYLVLPVTAAALLLGFSPRHGRLLLGLGLLQYGILFVSTYIVRSRLKEYPEWFFTCPMGGLMVQWIAAHSFYAYVFGKKIPWKGRDLNA